MGLITGLGLGLGLLLVFLSMLPTGRQRPKRLAPYLVDLLLNAGMRGVSVPAFVAASLLLGLLGAMVTISVTGLQSVTILVFFVATATPLVIIRARGEKNKRARRAVWPEVVEHLISAIGAGLSLPEAVAQLERRGPELIRPEFALFARDYRASGRFDESLLTLKARLADPVADRVLEALRITRAVGGNELGNLLRTLSGFLREELRIRGELEARQSWTAGSAKVAAAAPWVVLFMLATRREAASAYDTPLGMTIIALAAVVTVAAYWLMLKIAKLPVDRRVLR